MMEGKWIRRGKEVPFIKRSFVNFDSSEQLDDDERMLLGEDEPLFVSPGLSPRSRTRHWSGEFSQSPEHDRTPEVEPGADDDDDYVASSSKRRRSGRKRSNDVVRDALKSLVIRRKLKSKSGESQGKNVPTSSSTSDRTRRPRRLPVDELVTVPERFEDSDLENEEGGL